MFVITMLDAATPIAFDMPPAITAICALDSGSKEQLTLVIGCETLIYSAEYEVGANEGWFVGAGDVGNAVGEVLGVIVGKSDGRFVGV